MPKKHNSLPVIISTLVAILILICFGIELKHEIFSVMPSENETPSLWDKYRDFAFLTFATFTYIADTTGFLEKILGEKFAIIVLRLLSISFIVIPSLWISKEMFKGGLPLAWIIIPFGLLAIILILCGMAESKRRSAKSNDVVLNALPEKETESTTSNDDE